MYVKEVLPLSEASVVVGSELGGGGGELVVPEPPPPPPQALRAKEASRIETKPPIGILNERIFIFLPTPPS
jgi:hypothetical protein